MVDGCKESMMIKLSEIGNGRVLLRLHWGERGCEGFGWIKIVKRGFFLQKRV